MLDQKKNCSRFPTGIGAACQRWCRNLQYHQHYSYSWESLKWAICFAIFWFKNGPTVHAAPLQKCGTTTPRSHHCVSLLKKSIRCLAILTVKRFCGFFSNMQQQQLWKSLQICTHTYAYPGNLTSTIWRLLIHIQIAAAYCCFCHWELLREIERKYY